MLRFRIERARFPRERREVRGVAFRPESRWEMALRSFADRTGCTWNVWNVQPTMATSTLEESLQGGWLCFQREAGGERFRLRLCDAPPAWEQLAADRLDLLRRVAEAELRENPDNVLLPSERTAHEDHAKGRVSGPRAVVGDEELHGPAELT